MDDLEKLKRLLHHWMEHNEEHARTYREWAERIKAEAPELSKILSEIAAETDGLQELFRRAERELK